MADRRRVAVLISGRGTNMPALVYAARADDSFEVALVSGDKPAAPGLALAKAEGVSGRSIGRQSARQGQF